MKKRINIILIVISLILTLLVGCGGSSASNNDKGRFVMTYQQTTGDIFYIILDTETNVEYLYIRSGYSGSITKLEKGENNG